MAKKKPDKEGVVQLFKEADVPVQRVVAKRTTVADRKTLMLEALRNKDPQKVAELTVIMAGFMQKVLKPLGDSVILDQANADHLIEVTMEAHQTLAELMDVVWEESKRIVFDHLDAVYAKDGEKIPAALNGAVESPKLGLKLCREGAGIEDPQVDHDLLQEILGDRWQEVYDERTIPAQTVYDFNPTKLRELAYNEPENTWLEKIRPALTPGGLKKGKLNLRNINPQDYEDDPIDG